MWDWIPMSRTALKTDTSMCWLVYKLYTHIEPNTKREREPYGIVYTWTRARRRERERGRGSREREQKDEWRLRWSRSGVGSPCMYIFSLWFYALDAHSLLRCPQTPAMLIIPNIKSRDLIRDCTIEESPFATRSSLFVQLDARIFSSWPTESTIFLFIARSICKKYFCPREWKTLGLVYQ